MIKSVKEYMHEVSYFLKSWSMIKNIKKMRVQKPSKKECLILIPASS